MLYAFSESSNIANTVGIGVNLGGWLGIHAGISEDFNVFAGAQITPLIHVSGSIGLDGVGLSIGTERNNVSADFEVKCGWGLAVAVAACCFGIPVASFAMA